MSQKDPGTEFNPRHRILGAVILVSAAVIFIPLILSEREPPATDAPSAIAGDDRPSEQMKVAVTDLRRTGPGPAARPEPVPMPETRSATPEQPARPVPAASRPITSDAPPAPTAVAPAKPASTPDRGWVVQVGTFANTGNAERLEAKLRQLGHAVRNERIALASGNAVRLRVGPFQDKALALKAQAQIQKEIGVQGVVLAYP